MPAFNLEQIEQRIHSVVDRAIEFEGICFRNVKQKYANPRGIVSTEGSKRGRRFNPKDTFGVLYLACDSHTCLEETIHSATDGGFNEEAANRMPLTVVGVKVALSKVLDLTNSKIRRTIGISKSVLTDTDWEQSQNIDGVEAITQAIGRFAKEAGFEAILVPSAVRKGENLDIFHDNLLPSSQIQ